MYLFSNVEMLHYLFDYTVSSYFWYLRVKKITYRFHYIVISFKQRKNAIEDFYFSSFMYNLENIYIFFLKYLFSMYLTLIYLSDINTRLLLS